MFWLCKYFIGTVPYAVVAVAEGHEGGGGHNGSKSLYPNAPEPSRDKKRQSVEVSMTTVYPVTGQREPEAYML